ncbi:protein SSXA1 [Pteropus alecto]|uniref:protein SSXA1 n=1 Tax=Pteropus alecto TaxID=9402 RepID=UPI0003F12ED9|nr:protein SSXA1 [Pteropus alecto]
MNRGSSFAKSSRKDSQKSEEKCKAFKDICKYFSKEEWAKLGNSQKYTYVYMKRNYDTMTGLGLNVALPAFMNPNKRTAKSPENDSHEDQNPGNQGKEIASSQQMEKSAGPGTVKSNVWAYRLRERKNKVVYEEISDPEEDE